MTKPRLFIGSSSEGLSVAYAIQENLDHDAETTVWSQGVFELSAGTLDSLLTVLENVDFGVFVFTPDDITKLRGREVTTARDNVVFELGMFIGRLGRTRSFIVMPRGQAPLHLPSDLAGLNPATWEANRSDGNLPAALGAACNQIRRAIQQHGRLRESPPLVTSESTRDAVLQGIQYAAGVLGRALGPLGRGVTVEVSGGAQIVARGGAMIAHGLRRPGSEMVGVRAVQEITRELATSVGGGSKIAGIMMGSLTEHAHRALADGIVPQQFVTEMEEALQHAKSALAAQARPANSSTLLQVASTAAMSREYGAVITKAIQEVGPLGQVTITEGDSTTPELVVSSGVHLEAGYVSPEFANASPDGRVELDDCLVLLTPDNLPHFAAMLELYDTVAASGRPLLVVAPDLDRDTLATFTLNFQRGTFKAIPVTINRAKARARTLLDDLAAITGATVLAADAGRSVISATVQSLGRAARVIVERDRTTLMPNAQQLPTAAARITVVRAELERSRDDFEREQIRSRLAMLEGAGVASVLIGGVTYSDHIEARYALESALSAARRASDGGTVPGAGEALSKAAQAVRSACSGTRGSEAIAAALETPIKYLIESRKGDPIVTLPLMHERGAGYNVTTGQAESATDAGILDAADIIVRTLETAYAHARRFTLTASWIVSLDRDGTSVAEN